MHDAETLAFLNMNDAAVKQFGYSPEEFLTMTMRELWAAPGGGLVALSGDSKVGKCRKKDGSLIDVELFHTSTLCRGRKAWLVLARDITDRVRAEERLRVVLKEKELLVKEVYRRVKNNLVPSAGPAEVQGEPGPHPVHRAGA